MREITAIQLAVLTALNKTNNQAAVSALLRELSRQGYLWCRLASLARLADPTKTVWL